MVEAIGHRPSVAKGILATTVAAGILNAGISTGCEMYRVSKEKKNAGMLAAVYNHQALRFKHAGRKEDSKFCLRAAKTFEEAFKNAKINWKSVGASAAVGALGTALICTVFYAVSSLFNRH